MFILFFLLSLSVFAEEPRHMVSLGSNGFGFSGERERINGESSSPFEDVTALMLNVTLNYAYRITDRQQVGVRFTNRNHEHTFKRDDGVKTRSEEVYQSYGLYVLHLFSDELSSAYFLGAGVSHYNLVEEISHDFAASEGKAPIEKDDQGWTYELFFGKRFTLAERLSYAPQIGFFHRTHAKDFDDQKIRSGYGVSFDLIKFDYFF